MDDIGKRLDAARKLLMKSRSANEHMQQRIRSLAKAYEVSDSSLSQLIDETDKLLTEARELIESTSK